MRLCAWFVLALAHVAHSSSHQFGVAEGQVTTLGGDIAAHAHDDWKAVVDDLAKKRRPLGDPDEGMNQPCNGECAHEDEIGCAPGIKGGGGVLRIRNYKCTTQSAWCDAVPRQITRKRPICCAKARPMLVVGVILLIE